MPPIDQLTDDEIRVEVARAMGWRVFESGADGLFARPPESMLPEWAEKDCPDYPSDLNACHEMENTFPHPSDFYRSTLAEVCGGGDLIYRATARQRCIEFLKVRGVL